MDEKQTPGFEDLHDLTEKFSTFLKNIMEIHSNEKNDSIVGRMDEMGTRRRGKSNGFSDSSFLQSEIDSPVSKIKSSRDRRSSRSGLKNQINQMKTDAMKQKDLASCLSAESHLIVNAIQSLFDKFCYFNHRARSDQTQFISLSEMVKIILKVEN